MGEKVLGFKEKDVLHGYPMEDGGEIVIKLNKLEPVISLQEHNEEIEKLRKHLDAVITFREKKFVSLQAIKEWVEKNKFGYNPPRVNAKELIKFIEDQGGEKKE